MAALTIRWTGQAIADVDHIYDFIAARDPRAARAIVDRIDRAITNLTLHPRIGRFCLIESIFPFPRRQLIPRPSLLTHDHPT
jgi:plasmid stabilization system protein ParE